MTAVSFVPSVKTLQQIADELQAYDPQAMSADDVSLFLSKLVVPVAEARELPLFESLGRVLAEDVISPLDVPPHDNSAMDGYAFAGAALAKGEPLQLQVIGTAYAGKAWQDAQGSQQVLPGQCVKIMTGAIMPPGLDTVVPQELLIGSARQETCITIPPQLLRQGDNRRLQGEDLALGKVALRQGERLTPARLGLAASLGLKTLKTWRPLRVAYFSTGNEILSLGEPPREGAVYDSNRYTIFGLLSRMGCEIIDMGVVGDDPGQLEAAFTQAAARSDAIISSGGVSVGEADHTRTVMKKLGDVAFWRIAMRPGRPMAVGRIASVKSASNPMNTGANSYANHSKSSSTVLFGLPGNPVAVMVTFLVFVRPALLQMMGASAEPTVLLKARSLEAIRKKPGRTEYMRVRVSTQTDGSLALQTSGSQGSGVLRSMAEANGLLVLSHRQASVEVGDEVDVMMFDGVI